MISRSEDANGRYRDMFGNFGTQFGDHDAECRNVLREVNDSAKALTQKNGTCCFGCVSMMFLVVGITRKRRLDHVSDRMR